VATVVSVRYASTPATRLGLDGRTRGVRPDDGTALVVTGVDGVSGPTDDDRIPHRGRRS